VFYMLLVGWFVRIATLIVLAGIAPVALACYALPQPKPPPDRGGARCSGCLATPLLQAIFFATGVNLLIGPEHNSGKAKRHPIAAVQPQALARVVLGEQVRGEMRERRFCGDETVEVGSVGDGPDGFGVRVPPGTKTSRQHVRCGGQISATGPAEVSRDSARSSSAWARLRPCSGCATAEC
jgi:hypothetical protein